MPKQVDYESRRRRIAEAVCLLSDEHGPEGVTMRDVATRAEVSLGAVQRCFRNKEEMLLFAVDHVGERITERVRTRLSSSPAQSAATALGHAATEIALLRRKHRAEARVWLAFVAQAAVSEPLAAKLRISYAALQDLLARLITEASESGPADDDAATLDPQREARALLALADGLTSHVLIGHLTSEEAEDALHVHLVRLWERLPTSRPGKAV
ncbi:TetR/AcrR family transcriptional regulator [Streptomyces coeruleorubidus]|uniref:TetR family transcriptional regulator n=1 Tax=Streptomyces coeruleorubidus TaxID=116188 RepID=A0A5J6IN10_STRC4|nr:TetR family transcriptional regulator C-terminal domain-containing protein [Streptomyces coeruleorubidus]QEV30037.1 TetR family transcriptional regulator [Streptomyces coeruleorubidus]GGU05878.1 HTH-type transcriptional regulator PksA [Streptomyces coeruleorubidus]